MKPVGGVSFGGRAFLPSCLPALLPLLRIPGRRLHRSLLPFDLCAVMKVDAAFPALTFSRSLDLYLPGSHGCSLVLSVGGCSSVAALPAGGRSLTLPQPASLQVLSTNVRLLVHVHLDSDHPEMRSLSEEPWSGEGLEGRFQSSQGQGSGLGFSEN